MVRFQISLDDISFQALRQLANCEYRDPRKQAGGLIRESLVQRGLLETTPNKLAHSVNGSSVGDKKDEVAELGEETLGE